MNTKTIKFDLNKYKLYEKIKAKQGDTKSRFLLFQLLDGSIPFNLKNRSVRAYMIKPDGREIFNDLIVNNYNLGYCTLELTNQVLAAQGIVKIELMVTEGDKKLTSSVFELEVVKSINSEKSIVSTNEFTALLNGLAALSEYDNYKNSVKEMEINKANKAEVEEKFISVEEKIKNNSEQLEQKASKKDLEIERNRINLLTKIEAGETEGNTELLDIRNGADGVVYNTAGESVREQFKNVNNKVLNTDTIIMNNSLSEEKKGTSVNFENTRSDIPLFIKGFNKTINNLFDKNEVEMLDGFWQTDTGMMVAGDGNYGFLFDVSMYTGETITVSEITPTPGDAKYISLFSGKPQANSIPLVFDTFKVSTEFEGRSYASVPVIENAKYLFVWYGAYAENENPNYYLDTMQIEVGINPSKYVPHDGFKITACGKNVFSAWKDKYYVGDRPSGQQLILMDNPLENEIRFRGNGGSYAECYYKIYNLIPNTYYTASAKVIENNAFFNARCYGGTTDENGTLTVTFVGCDSETLEYYHFITFSNIQVELGEKQTEYEPYTQNEIVLYNDSEFPVCELKAYNNITNVTNANSLILDIVKLEDINFLEEVKKMEIGFSDTLIYKKLKGKSFNVEDTIDYKIIIEKSENGKITVCKKNVFSALKDEYYVGNRPSGQQLIIDKINNTNEIRFRGNGGSYAECYYKIYNLMPNTYYIANADITENTTGYNARCYGGTTDENGTLTLTFVGCDSETLEYYNFITFSNIQVELGDKRTEFEKYMSNEVTINNDEFPFSKLYSYKGITNILSNMEMDIKVPVNSTCYVEKLKAKSINYNSVATMRDYKGNLKSINEDEIGNLKLFPINNKKVKGRSKFNGNIYYAPYNSSKCRVIDPNGAIIFEKELGKKVYNFEKHYNSKGQLRYTYGVEGGEPVQISTGGYFTQYYNIVDENFNFIKKDIKLKASGNVTEGHPCENHFFEYIDDNHYIVSAYVGTVVDNVPELTGSYKACNCVIQEIKNDELVFHWESVNHSEFYNYSCFHKDFSNFTESQETYNDYCHLNALAIDPKDDNFIVSFRHTGLAKLNRKTGEVIWLFGRGGRIDFEGMTNEHCGYLQHDIRICDDGSLTIFDNSGCSTDNSRICRYWIDEENMKLVKFKEYVTPRKRSMFMGSAILLDDETETFLVCYGGLGTSEGTPDTSVLFDEINFLTGETNFTLENDLCAYRVIKYPNECKS